MRPTPCQAERILQGMNTSVLRDWLRRLMNVTARELAQQNSAASRQEPAAK